MKKEEAHNEQALENKCPSCKASITFNPKLGKWKCEYCGSEFSLEDMQKHSDNASTEKNNSTDEKETNDTDYVNYHCESCGAEIIADEQTSATFCVYCGNTAILKSKLSGKFNPSKIIPFKKEKKDAITAFKSLSKGRPLVPKSFVNEKNIEKIRGIYIPFWLYDINVSGDIVMTGENVRTWTTGDTRYTKTDTYHVVRGGSIDFSSIPIDGSTRFDNDIMNTIEPFDYSEMVPYNHAYLSGFYAEKYDIEGEPLLKEVQDRALTSSKNILQDDAKRYMTKVITSNSLVATEKKRSYALFPVWMVNVKYQGKMHIFAMNGQTGEFIGNIPLDKRKAILYSILIFLITLILCIIGSYVIFKLGGN